MTPEDHIKGAFPSLVNDECFSIIGYGQEYNCLAHAANETRWFYWPSTKETQIAHLIGACKWPNSVPNSEEKEVLIQFYKEFKYEVCKDAEYAEGFKKIALYEKDNKFTHAARQLTHGDRKGKWSSKLGPNELILHKTPSSVEGQIYGNVFCYMKKSMK